MSIDNQMMNRNLATIGWGALFVWWGISILVGPITIGMSATGTGLILLGVNAARMFKGIPIKNSNTAVAVIAIAWGSLDHVLSLQFWPSFATLMIVIGVVAIASLVTQPQTA
jgi:hypothetical protein